MKISVFDIDETLSEGFFIVEFPGWLCKNKGDAFDPAKNNNIMEFYRIYLTHEPCKGKPYEYGS